MTYLFCLVVLYEIENQIVFYDRIIYHPVEFSSLLLCSSRQVESVVGVVTFLFAVDLTIDRPIS